MNKKTVSVYGYGRFGKFWADILAADFNVKVYSRRGLKAHEVSDGIQITDEQGIFDCDAIFFCVAISAFKNVLLQSKSFFKDHTVFFDTCSVKVAPARWMNRYLPENSVKIATHPMFGPDSYINNADLPMVMCNQNASVAEFDFWVSYFGNKKMRVETMTVYEHDEKVAYSQGITHYVGRVLADLQLSSTNIDTLGYKKLLEIIEQTCNDNWQLFIDLQSYNPYTKKMRGDLHESIQKIYSILNIENKT